MSDVPGFGDEALAAAISVLGGKWKLIILGHLSDQTRRFNELRRLMPHITQRMLTLQLRELESDGLITRKVYPQVPPKVEYSLTNRGQSLGPVLTTLRQWGQTHVPAPNTPVAKLPTPATPPPEAAVENEAKVAMDTPKPARPVDAKPQSGPSPRIGRPWGSTGTADVT